GVFSGWERVMTTSGELLSDRDRDRLIIRACAASPIMSPIPGITPEREVRLSQALREIRAHTSGPLTVITRDGRLIREAARVSVDAADPETFAARTMSRDAARGMFESRFDQAMSRYIARGPMDEWLLRVRATDRLRQLYAAVWTPPDQPRLPLPDIQ